MHLLLIIANSAAACAQAIAEHGRGSACALRNGGAACRCIRLVQVVEAARARAAYAIGHGGASARPARVAGEARFAARCARASPARCARARHGRRSGCTPAAAPARWREITAASTPPTWRCRFRRLRVLKWREQLNHCDHVSYRRLKNAVTDVRPTAGNAVDEVS